VALQLYTSCDFNPLLKKTTFQSHKFRSFSTFNFDYSKSSIEDTVEGEDQETSPKPYSLQYKSKFHSQFLPTIKQTRLYNLGIILKNYKIHIFNTLVIISRHSKDKIYKTNKFNHAVCQKQTNNLAKK